MMKSRASSTKKILPNNSSYQPRNLTLQEVADCFGLTKERIRQIEDKALIKLRGRLQAAQISPLDIYGDSL